MTKRDKFVAARIPKETDTAVKKLLKRDAFKHRSYSDVINIALEAYVKTAEAYPTPNTDISEYMLDGDIKPPAYGAKRKKGGKK